MMRNFWAFLAAVATSTILGTLFHTQMVFARLADAGAALPLSVRLQGTVNDLLGLGPLYGAVIALGLAAGFSVAARLKRVLKPLAPIAYPLAGAAVIGLALYLMSVVYYSATPIAGARGVVGFSLQCLAGAIGGLVFAALLPRKA
ncbi:MAG: hypothetical protein WD076_07570 [Parvularculaceae bacterium]